MTAKNVAVLITEPAGGSLASRCGIPCLQHKNTLVRFAV
jgi:hypothetical protein